jgi:hypothetical protein
MLMCCYIRFSSSTWKIFFVRFPNLFAICRDTFSKWCVGKRGRVEERSVAPLPNKRVKTLCGCREKRVQTKEKYKLRLTTKAYKLSYNYINYTINLVGRSFGRRLKNWKISYFLFLFCRSFFFFPKAISVWHLFCKLLHKIIYSAIQ